MFNPKVMEAWLTLMTEASKGASDAQEAFKMFPKAANNSPEEVQRWMSRFMSPQMPVSPNDMTDWYEDWCRMMGVVPRMRYLELLDRYETIRKQLEEAEEKIKHLRALLAAKGHEEEAKVMLDMWGSTIEKTLKAQSDWMRAWSAPLDKENTDSTK